MKKNAEDIINKEIILFALYELGGAQGPVHTEDVAHRVFQYPIGRQKYRWEKYKKYPDKERIARELRWLKNWKGICYVKGHVNIGARGDRIDFPQGPNRFRPRSRPCVGRRRPGHG